MSHSEKQDGSQARRTRWAGGLRTFIPAALVAVGLCIHAPAASAAIVWRAGFESYTDGQAVTQNSSGANETIESNLVINAGTGGAGAFAAESTPDASFVTGNAAEWYRTASGGGNSTIQLRRRNLSISSNQLAILSFDAEDDGSTANGIGFDFYTSSTRLGPTSLGIGLPFNSLRRLTAVANRTGTTLTLPGGLAALVANDIVLYAKDSGGTYTELGRQSVSVGNYGLNTIGFYLSSSPDTTTWKWTFDNFVLSSTLDTKDGVTGSNILQWSPGTLSDLAFADSPEPATITLLLCGGLVLWRRGLRTVAVG